MGPSAQPAPKANPNGPWGAGERLPDAPRFNIRQLTDVLRCKLQQHLRCNEHYVGQPRNRIDAMASTSPTVLHQRRLRLAREPIAVAEARRQVRAVIGAWQVPVDPDIAILLTSDLVTHAITHGAGKTVTLAITCPCGHLRIDVYDMSRSLPMATGDPARTETGRWLVLIAALSAQWGSFRTPAGEVVYFTLAFQPGLPGVGDGAPVGGYVNPSA
jgi:hypothetical protein